MALLGGLLYYLFANLDSFAKQAVEKYGSQATQTSVRLDSVKLALGAGEGFLGGLHIANPSGFSSTDALSFDAVNIKLDTQSLRGAGPIVIREITIDAPRVNYERDLSSGNLEILRQNVTSYANGNSSAPSIQDSTAEKRERRKIVIDDLYVRNGKVSVSDVTLKAAAITTDLPMIHLTNIGRDEGGATPAEVTEKIIGTITRSAMAVGTSALTNQGRALEGKVLDQSGGGRT